MDNGFLKYLVLQREGGTWITAQVIKAGVILKGRDKYHRYTVRLHPMPILRTIDIYECSIPHIAPTRNRDNG